MKKKIRLITNKPIFLLICAVLIILTAGLIVNSIALFNAIKTNNSPTIPIVWIVSCIIELAVLMVLLINRHITLTTTHMIAVTGVFFNRISYDDILLVREDKSTPLLLVYYKVYNKAGDELVNYRVVPIKAAYYAELITDLRKFNSSIVHENFDKNAANSDDKSAK